MANGVGGLYFLEVKENSVFVKKGAIDQLLVT